MAATVFQPTACCHQHAGCLVAFLSYANPLCAVILCCLLQFNAGSAGGAGYIAGQAFINTQASAASAMLAFMLMVRTDTLQHSLTEKG